MFVIVGESNKAVAFVKLGLMRAPQGPLTRFFEFTPDALKARDFDWKVDEGALPRERDAPRARAEGIDREVAGH